MGVSPGVGGGRGLVAEAGPEDLADGGSGRIGCQSEPWKRRIGVDECVDVGSGSKADRSIRSTRSTISIVLDVREFEGGMSSRFSVGVVLEA